MEKKNVIIFIVSFVILALAGLGFLAWRSAQPAPVLVQPQPTPTSQIPKDWKTYTNTKYHYSFRYPAGYYIYQWSGGEGYPIQITDDAVAVAVSQKKDTDSIFNIDAATLKDINDIDSIKSQSGATDPKNINLIKTTIAGQQGYSVEFKQNGEWKFFGLYYVKNLYDNTFAINDSPNPIAHQIFSSLKFTK